MEIFYKKNQYITMEERIKLSEKLNLSESQIKIWFQNRRAKGKRSICAPKSDSAPKSVITPESDSATKNGIMNNISKS